MKPISGLFFALLTWSALPFSAFASPWFTGPILAPNGHVIPEGHTNLELYGFNINSTSVFDNRWKKKTIPYSRSVQFNPIFSHGLNSFMDLQFSPPYVWNRFDNIYSHGLADSTLGLGFQFSEQKDRLDHLDLRIVLQEVIPTGRYQQLGLTSNGVDATGVGSYQTGIFFNFQHLLPLMETHYLRNRLSLGFVYPSYVRVKGPNAFGGGQGADGQISPGNLGIIDAASEFTLTQNWVAVMELYFAYRQPTKLVSGFAGTTPTGQIAPIGQDELDALSLAPALEYNFNDHMGLIGGIWFSAKGKNTLNFAAGVLALNVYL